MKGTQMDSLKMGRFRIGAYKVLNHAEKDRSVVDAGHEEVVKMLKGLVIVDMRYRADLHCYDYTAIGDKFEKRNGLVPAPWYVYENGKFKKSAVQRDTDGV